MVQLIDKSALIAEIEKLKDYADEHWDNEEVKGVNKFLDRLEPIIKTLEVKEMDLEDAKKEKLAQKYVDYTFRRHNIDPESKEGQLIYYAYMHGMNQCLTQLRAQKGE